MICVYAGPIKFSANFLGPNRLIERARTRIIILSCRFDDSLVSGSFVVDDMVVVWLIAALVSACVFGFAGAYISRKKNRDPIEGVLFGVLLGPIGLIIAAILPTGKATDGDAHVSDPAPVFHPEVWEKQKATWRATRNAVSKQESDDSFRDQENDSTNDEGSHQADLDAAALLEELDTEAHRRPNDKQNDDSG